MNKYYKYIFEDSDFENRTRFGWINDCLLGDIQTFLDGIQNFTQNKRESPDNLPRGGGNLSVPILISTALEFVSELYTGKTSYIWYFRKNINPENEKNEELKKECEELKKEWDEFNKKDLENRLTKMVSDKKHKINSKITSISKNSIEIDRYLIKRSGEELNVYEKYNATENVRQFITCFFPESSPESRVPFKKLPLLLWDGIRNGIIHTFYPKPFVYNKQYVRFQFFVEDRKIPSNVVLLSNATPVPTSGEVYTTKPPLTDSSGKKIEDSYSKQPNNTILIRINVFELFDDLKKAIENYRNKLEKCEDLQEKFCNAWRSIEEYTPNVHQDDPKSKEIKILLYRLNKTNK